MYLNYYIIIKEIDGIKESRTCITADKFDIEHIAMVVGFDPYDPFANYTIKEDLIDYNLSSMYGSISVVMDQEEAEEIYKNRYNSVIAKEEIAV